MVYLLTTLYVVAFIRTLFVVAEIINGMTMTEYLDRGGISSLGDCILVFGVVVSSNRLVNYGCDHYLFTDMQLLLIGLMSTVTLVVSVCVLINMLRIVRRKHKTK